ncbi:MAG: hypothetical protein WCT05_14590, partial [Lentisphaeria bacterium]
KEICSELLPKFRLSMVKSYSFCCFNIHHFQNTYCNTDLCFFCPKKTSLCDCLAQVALFGSGIHRVDGDVGSG